MGHGALGIGRVPYFPENRYSKQGMEPAIYSAEVPQRAIFNFVRLLTISYQFAPTKL